MDNWEKAKTVGSLLSSVLLPGVLLVVGSQLSAATKEREIESKFVELATQILREAPRSEAKPLREWATLTINRYSGVPLNQATAQSLIDTTALPAAPEDSAQTPSSAHWGVVLGGDATLDAARSEAAIYAKSLGIPNASVYLRNDSYRSVAVVGSDRSAAEDTLGRARQRRTDAYIVNMNTWCPRTTVRDGYIECLTR